MSAPQPSARPILTFNGLNALALPIALILHSSSGMVRMSTIRDVADARRLEEMLPEAVDQLHEWGLAEVCPLCDCLITMSDRRDLAEKFLELRASALGCFLRSREILEEVLERGVVETS